MILLDIKDTDKDNKEEPNYMLTTIDNPHSPFTQFDQWYAFDLEKGYGTCAYLARICKSSDELSELDEKIARHMAIDEIIKYNLLGIYRKVTIDSYKKELDK